MHRHKAKTSQDRPFFGCVRPERCKPGAHGNITVVQTCACGWQQRINVNGMHEESSGWYRPDGEDRD